MSVSNQPTSTLEKGLVYIGHAGWSYPVWRDGVWFPKGLKQAEEMRFYASKLNTTEINTTFYHLPQESNFVTWRDSVPAHFRFSLKFSRYLTHDHMLNSEEVIKSWPVFQERIMNLKSKLGPVLIQLPPHLTMSMEKLQTLAMLFPTTIRFAFEFRHDSWFCDEVYAFMKQNNWALVQVSSSKASNVERMTADFIYIRMHGIREMHKTLYTETELAPWADKIAQYAKDGYDVYCYFLSDHEGWGAKNAQTLSKQVTDRGATVPTPPASNTLLGFFAKTNARTSSEATSTTVAEEPASVADGGAEDPLTKKIKSEPASSSPPSSVPEQQETTSTTNDSPKIKAEPQDDSLSSTTAAAATTMAATVKTEDSVDVKKEEKEKPKPSPASPGRKKVVPVQGKGSILSFMKG